MKSKLGGGLRDNKMLLYGAALVLLLGLVVLIAVTFALSKGLPSLFSQCIGVVTINQELVTEGVPTGVFGTGIAGSEDIAQAIRELDRREDVGAVVFVINSPGGSVVASHEIYDAIKNVSKPKVAYFREVAASGGYYIATATDYIVSDPDALTGSIGVIATFTEMSDLFEEVGIQFNTIKSGEHKDIGSLSRNMDDEERAIFQNLINEVFDEFKGVVLENRGKKLKMEMFEQVLDGRVLSGRQAKEIGLVDAIGTKRDAIHKAAEMAGMEKDGLELCEVPIIETQSGLFNVEALKSVFKTQKKVELRYE